MSPAETRGLPHGRDPLTADGYARVAVPGAETKMGGNRRRGPVRGLIVTARPRQWIKNVLVIAAAGAAGALGRDDVPLRLTLAWAAFCLLASGIYAINDVRDVDEDRIHPGKRFRPIAAGEVDPRLATGFGISVIAAGLVACAAIRPLLALVGVAYVALTLSYTLLWRHIILLDVIAIAGGFVLRAIAGGVAAPVLLSRWFLTVVTCAAVFIAAGKRLAELRRSGGTTQGARKVLSGYTPLTLQLVLRASAALALFAYCVWAFQPFDVDAFPWRPLTIVPFAACLARYALHIQRGEGEAPEDLVLGDRWLSAAGITWVVLFGVSVYGGA